MPDASVSIRLNPFKGCDGPEGEPVPWSRYGRILKNRPVFTLDPLLHAGCYYVQDSSAMFVGHIFRRVLELAQVAGGIRVLDLCAAPGGKTTDAASSLRERYGDDFILVSNEVMKQRLPSLCDNVARWGDSNVLVTSADPAAFARLGPFFDVVIADVPCSGEGMFRKDERARREWSPAVVDLCISRQRRILADVWPCLREGGYLVYSTCTYEPGENDENLSWAADTLGGEIVAPRDEFSGYGVKMTPCGNLLEAGAVPGEGQWAGAMRRISRNTSVPSAELSGLRPRRFGISRGEMKGGALVPDADFALSLGYEDICPRIELDRDSALHFLHRDTICLPDAPLGFLAVTFRGHPLGFVKNLGKRCNNLLPQGRRILMNI